MVRASIINTVHLNAESEDLRTREVSHTLASRDDACDTAVPSLPSSQTTRLTNSFHSQAIRLVNSQQFIKVLLGILDTSRQGGAKLCRTVASSDNPDLKHSSKCVCSCLICACMSYVISWVFIQSCEFNLE